MGRSEIEALISEALGTAMEAAKSMGNTVQEGFAKALRSYDQKTNERFTQVECNISSLQEGQARLARQHQELRDELAKVSKALVVAESAVPPAKVVLEEFDAAPDASILRISAGSLVALSVVQEVVTEAWTSVGMAAADAKVVGAPLGRNFVIKFGGEVGLASRRANKTFTGLRSLDGSWKKYSVSAPGGDAVELFIGKDKNEKTIKEETAARKLLRAFKRAHPDRNIFLVKRDSQITVDWVPVAQIRATVDETTVLWNYKGVDSTKVDDKNDIMAAFDAGGNGRDAIVEWCI